MLHNGALLVASNNIHISIGMLPPRTMSIDVCSAPLECVVRSTGPQAKHYTIAVAGRADETDAHVRPISALLRSFHGPLHLFGVGSFRAKSIDIRIGTSLSALSLSLSLYCTGISLIGIGRICHFELRRRIPTAPLAINKQTHCRRRSLISCDSIAKRPGER